MPTPSNHAYQEEQVLALTVDEVNVLTKRARLLPPSGDQAHVIMDEGEDPWVISHNGSLFYCTVDHDSDSWKKKILISKFDDLSDISTAPFVEIWPGHALDLPEYSEVWSPELQYLDGKWYVYFALYNRVTRRERVHVLEGTSSDPQGSYAYKGAIEIPTDQWAIDGSVLETPNGEKYFIWSGWEGAANVAQNIYIAKMSDPLTIASDRVCISRPEHDWEKHGYPFVNEGPQALIHDGKIFIIYSASESWTDDYCLGQLRYRDGDLLDPESWIKEPRPVFSKTDTIFAPGHASFVTVNGQDWIVYHAARSRNAGWARQIRAKPFTWNEDGSPNFGEPL